MRVPIRLLIYLVKMLYFVPMVLELFLHQLLLQNTHVLMEFKFLSQAHNFILWMKLCIR